MGGRGARLGLRQVLKHILALQLKYHVSTHLIPNRNIRPSNKSP